MGPEDKTVNERNPAAPEPPPTPDWTSEDTDPGWADEPRSYSGTWGQDD